MTSAKSDLGIVVGVDESSGANTVRWAAHEAALRKIPLTLVRVGLMPASGPSARVWTTAPTLNELREQHADEAQQMLSRRSRSSRTALTVATSLLSIASCSIRRVCRRLLTFQKRLRWWWSAVACTLLRAGA